MKLCIVSDGTSRGTRVLTETGELVERVTGVSWSVQVNDPHAEVSIKLRGIPVRVVAVEPEVFDD